MRVVNVLKLALFAGVFASAIASADKIEARSDLFEQSHPSQYKTWGKTTESSNKLDVLAEDPKMIILWAGYPFSKDYNKARGHAYMIQDIRETLRTAAPMTEEDGPLPMACWSCKGPDVAREILAQGEDDFFKGKWARGGAYMVNSVGCADCMDE